jgi:holo-[acyl-carrier protein] synthase
MAIFGIGADLVDSPRVERLISRNEDIFRSRILGASERSEIPSDSAKPSRVLAYARSIAAKEAFLKALGTGFTQGMRWPDIEIVEGRSHAPRIALSGVVAQAFDDTQANRIHLSLSSVGAASRSSQVLAIVTLSCTDAPETSL